MPIKMSFLKIVAPLWMVMLTFIIHNQAMADDLLRIVGSSTVYPFAKQVTDRLSDQRQGSPVAKIESTGSGGGFQLFCEKKGPEQPDITNASRRIKRSEYDICQKNGVSRIVEVKMGYDGIVLASSRRSTPLSLTRKDIFLALAAQVPAADGSETVVANPHRTWKDVNPSLPDQPIIVLGPPPTSGTRDAFEELAMEEGCLEFKWLHNLKKKNKILYRKICRGIRQDGVYTNAGENDRLIVRRVSENRQALGIFGFSYLNQNRELINGAVLEGVEPTFKNIASGAYPLSRPLFFYVNAAHMSKAPAIREYINEFTNDSTWGPDGYLAAKGLIPMPPEERRQYRQAGDSLTIFSMQ